MPKALKSCPKSNKLPNLVTLEVGAFLLSPELGRTGPGTSFFRYRLKSTDELNSTERSTACHFRIRLSGQKIRLRDIRKRIRVWAEVARLSVSGLLIAGRVPEVAHGVDRQHLLLLEGWHGAAGKLELANAHLE